VRLDGSKRTTCSALPIPHHGTPAPEAVGRARPKVPNVNANTLHTLHYPPVAIQNMGCYQWCYFLLIPMRQRVGARLPARMYSNRIPVTRNRNGISNCSYLSVPSVVLLRPQSVVALYGAHQGPTPGNPVGRATSLTGAYLLWTPLAQDYRSPGCIVYT